MILTYNTGIKAFEDGDVLYATKMFKEAELLFPNQYGHLDHHLCLHMLIIVRDITMTQ